MSVVRGGHRNGETDPFHAPQLSRRREQPATDRYAARQTSQTGRDRRFERRAAQNNWYVRPTQIERAGSPANKIPSDDPNISAKVRIIHRLIKAVHHLKNVARDIYPPSLNKIAHNLMTVIKPAIPNRKTQTVTEGNARTWAHTAILILRDHYTENIEKEMKALSEFPKQDWGGPFEIATPWAKRNLGRRLQPNSLEQARAEIVAKLADLRAATGTVEENTAREPGRQPQGSGEMQTMQLDTIELLTEVTQPTVLHTQPAPQETGAGQMITVLAQVHDPPATCTTFKTTTATMTDHITRDWSPFSEREQEQESESRPTSPPETSQAAGPNPVAPKDQRVERILTALQETPIQEKPPSLSIQPPQSVDEMNTLVLDLTQGESTPKKTRRVNTVTVPKPQLQITAAEESSCSSPSPSSPASPGH